jgi:hypothetical protein
MMLPSLPACDAAAVTQHTMFLRSGVSERKLPLATLLVNRSSSH